MNPVCAKILTSPNSQSNLFAGDVSGVENYSNLFHTHPATYLPLILLGQPISKSYSQCPSHLSLVGNAAYQVFTPPPHYPSRHRNWQTQAPCNTSLSTLLTLSTHISVCISYRTLFWPAFSCLHIILSLNPYSTLQNDNK